MSLIDLLGVGHSPAHEEPAGSSGLGSLVRPEVAVELGRPNLPRLMNSLKRNNESAAKTQSTEKPAAEFDPRGMAERLGARRRALEMTVNPDQRKLARLTAYAEYLMETKNA
jgi:hypothetical protein